MSDNSILLLSPGTSIGDPKAGDQVRAARLLSELACRGWDVHVLEQGEQDDAQRRFDVYTFARLTPDRLNDLNPVLYLSLLRLLPKIEPDVVHVKTYSGVVAATLVARALGVDTVVTYDAQNVQGDKVQDGMDPSLPVYKRLLGPIVVPYLESTAIAAADHVVAVSEADKTRFVDRYDSSPEKITVVPSGTTVEPIPTDNCRTDVLGSHDLPTNASIAVFHGSYAYHPNKEAIELLKTRIAPQVNGEIHFAIAGTGVPEEPADRDNVTQLGFVDELHRLLCAADVAAVPLRSGGGTKLKMFDYMAAKLPVVTTEIGVQGIDAVHDEHLLIADAVDDGFVRLLEQLTQDEARQQQLGRNARTLVEQRYDWDVIGQQLHDLYTNL